MSRVLSGAGTLRVKTCLAIIAVLLSTGAMALPLPTEGLAKYDDYRAALLASGWEPIPRKYADRFPEVECTQHFCTAAWVADGRTIQIWLWPTADQLWLALDVEWDIEIDSVW